MPEAVWKNRRRRHPLLSRQLAAQLLQPRLDSALRGGLRAAA